MKEIDLNVTPLRELNQGLHDVAGKGGDSWKITNPQGRHAIACGIDAEIDVEIDGHAGYYAAGMNKLANVTINGNTGSGVAENIMSGVVRVKGNASQYAGATGNGGLLVIEGDASSRCGVSMKGVNIVVRGSVGNISGFMAQSGCMVIGGDTGEALGDSMYEAHIYVRGKVEGTGADCIEKEMKDEHRKELQALLDQAGFDDMKVDDFRRYGSARQLYNFNIDNLDAY